MIKRLFTVVALICATTVSSIAQSYVPDWYRKKANYFKAVEYNSENNFTMTVMGTIDDVRCDSAYEIGVFCGDECRLSMPFYSSNDMYNDFYYYSTLTIKGESKETISFRLYDHRNKTEVAAAVYPDEISFVSDKQYGSFNTELYNLAFRTSTTHRTALEIDDATDLPFTGKLYSVTADGIACCYTRNAYLDGGYETVVLPFDADITSIKAQGFVFEKFEGFGENTIKFVELEDDENLKAGVAYLFRYSGTPSDDRTELLFEAAVQQASDEIVSQEGWAGTFKAMSGSEVAGKYILNIKGDKMQRAGNGASLAPYHACLTLPAGTDAAMFSVAHRDNTTGIDRINIQNISEDIFDIYGRKLKEMPENGIIIKNNKKIYIK